MSETLPAPPRKSSEIASVLPPGLTQEEADFVYNVEVLRMPARAAARMANAKPGIVCAPHIIQARQLVKDAMRGPMVVTRDDVTEGYREAIDMARVMAEPEVMLKGWQAMAKLHGLEEASKVDINLNASVEVASKLVRTMSTEDLVAQLGASDLIDAEFYPVATND